MPRLAVDDGGGDPDDVYWCVVCMRGIPRDPDHGMFVHDDVPHPPDMTFAEEENPQ